LPDTAEEGHQHARCVDDGLTGGDEQPGGQALQHAPADQQVNVVGERAQARPGYC
jgi:hypothetical protein